MATWAKLWWIKFLLGETSLTRFAARISNEIISRIQKSKITKTTMAKMVNDDKMKVFFLLIFVFVLNFSLPFTAPRRVMKKCKSDTHARFLLPFSPFAGDEYLIKLESSARRQRSEWHLAAINLTSAFRNYKQRKNIAFVVHWVKRGGVESVWWISTKAKVFFLVRRLNVLRVFCFLLCVGKFENERSHEIGRVASASFSA